MKELYKISDKELEKKISSHFKKYEENKKEKERIKNERQFKTVVLLAWLKIIKES